MPNQIRKATIRARIICGLMDSVDTIDNFLYQMHLRCSTLHAWMRENWLEGR